MPEVAAVVPFQDPELRARAAESIPAEPHLPVEKGGEALLEGGALLLRRVAQSIELRLQLQRGERLPILRGVRTQARHEARVSEMWAVLQAGPCIRPQFPLEEAFRFPKETVWHARRAGEQGQAQARSRRSPERARRAGAAGGRSAIRSDATSSRRSPRSPSRSACTRRWTPSAGPSSTFPASWSSSGPARWSASPLRSRASTKEARGSTCSGSCAICPSPSASSRPPTRQSPSLRCRPSSLHPPPPSPPPLPPRVRAPGSYPPHRPPPTLRPHRLRKLRHPPPYPSRSRLPPRPSAPASSFARSSSRPPRIFRRLR